MNHQQYTRVFHISKFNPTSWPVVKEFGWITCGLNLPLAVHDVLHIISWDLADQIHQKPNCFSSERTAFFWFFSIVAIPFFPPFFALEDVCFKNLWFFVFFPKPSKNWHRHNYPDGPQNVGCRPRSSRSRRSARWCKAVPRSPRPQKETEKFLKVKNSHLKNQGLCKTIQSKTKGQGSPIVGFFRFHKRSFFGHGRPRKIWVMGIYISSIPGGCGI